MITTVSIRDALLDAAREVFETMAFMALEESEGGIDWKDEESLLGSITFKGSLEGCLGVYCSIACGKAIAASMLGMDNPDDLSETDVPDAIGEMANMIMGSLKSRIQETVGSMEVSIPSIVQGRRLKNSLSEGASEVVVNVSVEGQYATAFSLLYRETAA